MPKGIYLRTSDMRTGVYLRTSDMRNSRKVSREIRYCLCGCGFSKEVKVNSKWKYKHGHNPHKKILREARICACGCGESFECKVNSKKKYILGHHRSGFDVMTEEKLKDVCKKSLFSRRENGFKSGRRGKKYSERVLKFCECGCGKSKKVTIYSKWCFFGGHRKRNKTFEEIYGLEKALELKNGCSNRMQSMYASFTDEQKAKYLKNTLFKAGKRPNKFEIRCKELLDIYYPNEFKYCGNGTVVINGRNPDFVHKTKKIVVECNGVYWHVKKPGYEDTLGNRRTIELIQSEPFRAYGYEVWIIWEDKLSLNKVIILNGKEVEEYDKEICIGN